MTQDTKILKVMISSTARDLPVHRKEVMDACVRQGMFPMMMEHLPALDAEAIHASLDMVDEADIYLGVFAHRYGYIPKENNPEQISITEMEYNRAVERGIPRFIFLIHEDHPVKASDVEKGIGGEKLDAFKARLGTDRVANFFKNSEDMRAHVIDTLSRYKEAQKGVGKPGELLPTTDFHFVSTIPTPPETYIAHPYSLLQTHDLIGRRDELSLLTDWVANPESEVYNAHILSITAMGGMGKSALTWKWFNDIAPEEMKPLAGRMWWSFYESDASFENFIIRALAYTTGGTIDEIGQISPSDREAQLLSILGREPYLIVLDGLERLLIAYARSDAARLNDSEVESGKNVRKTSDPRVGQFLRKLAGTKRSRILLSTRLFPSELETSGGDPLPGVFNRELEGLAEGDAIELWRAFGVSGARDELRPVFDAIKRHPLLIQALAGEVKRYKSAPGDFAGWHAANSRFDPSAYPRVEDAMAHVMEYALRELPERAQRVLEVIAAFRMPTGYPTLAAILTGSENPCGSEMELDVVLVELEDRGLVGWDRSANRYDLHPIVRSLVWQYVNDARKNRIYETLLSHFEASEAVNLSAVNSLEDLMPSIELFYALIGTGRFDDAARLFYERLEDPTLHRLSASRLRVELVESFFPNGIDDLRQLKNLRARAFMFNALAQGYQHTGQPGRAIAPFRHAITLAASKNDQASLSRGVGNLSNVLRFTGDLRESTVAVYRALIISRKMGDKYDEAVSLNLLGLTSALRGKLNESKVALRRSLLVHVRLPQIQGQGVVTASLAELALSSGKYPEGLDFAKQAWNLAHANNLERDFIRTSRIHGEVSLGLGDRETADERLHFSLSRSRAVNLVQEELPALTALAELKRQQGYAEAARDLLDDVWEYAERGPYPLLHADALNVLAQIERVAGNTTAAIEAATKAYGLAWCDGPPYAYHWGLIKAQKHLEELGAQLPEMPPFDESKFEPMPEVEIDPEDEFHVGDTLSEEG